MPESASSSAASAIQFGDINGPDKNTLVMAAVGLGVLLLVGFVLYAMLHKHK